MAAGLLSIKLRCASWQQLASLYKRDLRRGTMFLRAKTPPPLGTAVRIDLALPSASVIVLTGKVAQHRTDPQRGTGVELELAPIPAASIWLIETALASESKRRNTPAVGVPIASPTDAAPADDTPALGQGEELATAEDELIKALLAEAESLKKLNPFLVLGVGYEASDADVRAAFGELTKRYHPDRFARYESTELRQVAAEIFILIRDAYRKLSAESGRAQSLAALGRTPAPRAIPLRTPAPPPVAVPRPSPSTRAPRPPESVAIPALRGAEPARDATGEPPRVAFRAPPRATSEPRASTSQPLPRFDAPSTDHRPVLAVPPPVLTEPSEGTPLAPSHDRASEDPIEHLLEQGKLDEASLAAKVLARKHPTDRTYRAAVEVCEGLRALAIRDRLEAAQRFEAALEIDPSNERAARELADMRRQATNERKGLLTRLMGKKE